MTLLFNKKTVTIGLIITALLSIGIAIVTFYGQQTGNFVMTVDPDAFERGIILSSDKEFQAPVSRLLANPVVNAKDITYEWLKLNEIADTDGDYVDEDYKYVAYSFYVKNNGKEAANLTYQIKITSVYKNVDKAIRILVIEDNIDHVVYQRADERPHDYSDHYLTNIPKAVNFLSDKIVCERTIPKFRPSQQKRVSVIIWLEGEDPDCTDEILGGMIKLQMLFNIHGEEA